MLTNLRKRLAVALLVILCAAAAGVVAHRGGGLNATPQHVAAQSVAQAPSRVASQAAPASSFGARITAAIKIAEAAPHGDIGTAAVATRP